MDPITSQLQIQFPDSKVTIGKNTQIDRNRLVRELKLRETSTKLEAAFLTDVIKTMEKTIPKGGLTGGKNNLPSMLFSSVMADALAKGNPTGLSDMFYQALTQKDGIKVPDIPGPGELAIGSITTSQLSLLKETP